MEMKLTEINLRNPVKIGYYDPFDVFPRIRSEFRSHFPLSNIHWRHHSSKPVKSIPLLPVHLEEEVPSIHTRNESKIPGADVVYTRIIFIKITDMETYRSQVRPLINEWLKALVKPQRTSWAIILVVGEGSVDKRSIMTKTSFYDKLKLDFGANGKQISLLEMPNDESGASSEKRQNILRIHESYTEEFLKLEVYKEVIATIKQLVLQTFNRIFLESTAQINQLILTATCDSAGKLELFRERLKLAGIFHDMRCLDESLDIYQELYANLNEPDFGVTESTRVRQAIQAFDYSAFDPEDIPKSKDPYVLFCEAVASRQPINIFAIQLGLFIKISILLQTLANFANSISISSGLISSLLQKSIGFLNDHTKHSTDCKEVDQWLYAMADFQSNLPIAKKLIELDKELTDVHNGVIATTGILEYIAELELFKRSILNKLAQNSGFNPPTANLFLDDVPISKNTIHSSDVFKVTVSELAFGIERQESYEELFKKLTISAIECYAICGRIKTIDILSIDLAIIHYRNHEYKEALDILQNSYDYFIENGWDYVGGMLLEVFLGCLEHVQPDDIDSCFTTILKLFASLRSDAGNRHDINDYSLVKSKKERLSLFKKLTALSENIDSYREFALENYFNFEFHPYIEFHQDNGMRYIVANFRNKFGISIQLMHIEVTFTSSDETGRNNVSFVASNTVLDEGASTSVKLYSRKFCNDLLKVQKISVHITEKLVFSTSYEKSSPEFADSTVIRHISSEASEPSPTNTALQNVFLQMYDYPDQFRFELKPSQRIELESPLIECTIHNGPKDLKNLSLSVTTSTDGLQIFNEPKQFDFNSITNNESASVLLDCTLGGKSVEIQIVCQYEVDGEKFEYCLRDSCDLSLKISISVHDIFRENSIYSKFQIGSVSSQNPVRAHFCEFKCTQEKYTVTGSKTAVKNGKSLVVYGEQPAFLFYKISPKEGFDTSDVLDFTIKFTDLDSECKEIVQSALMRELDKRNATSYFYLLVPTMLKLDVDLHRFSVEGLICATNIVHCTKLIDDVISKHIPPKSRAHLTGLMSSIFCNAALAQNIETLTRHSELYIPVSIPCLDMLHRVELIPDQESNFIKSEPINFELVIQSYAKWSDKKKGAVLATSSPRLDTFIQDMVFELTILDEEGWLISGLKKFNFSVEKDQSISKTNICLIPLQAGRLNFPRVSVKAIEEGSYTMDLIQENGLDTMYIFPELDSVSFAF